jgi:hypothetical protein
MNITPKLTSNGSRDANAPTHTGYRRYDFPSVRYAARFCVMTKAKDHDPERHDPGEHKANREMAEHIGAALDEARAQGRLFVLPWRAGPEANHPRWQPEYDCGCGCGAIE